jgi:drug/metabolite transporter (DMT)-like permease
LTEPADRRALAALVFGAAVIGLAPILVRLTATGPAAAGFWRLAFALPLLALIAGRADRGPPGAPPRAALLAGAMFALDIGFWHYGLHYTSVANATVLTNLTPVVVTLVAWLAFRQRPRLGFVAAVLLAVAGAWLMAAARGGRPGPDPPLGDALSLVTALWYALYLVSVGVARRRAGAARVMFWSTLLSAPLLLVAALAMDERLIPASAAGWAACAGLGLVHVAGQGTIAWSLGRLPATLASVVVLVQPVVAAVLGWLLFAESLSPLQALGGAVALAGAVLAQRAGGNPAQPAAKP